MVPISLSLLLSSWVPVVSQSSVPDFTSPGEAGTLHGRPTDSATVLFTIPEHDLYPESVAYDPESGDFFLSSMGQSRILRVHPDGTYEDFLAGPVPSLESSVGMKVDAQRRRLWVCTGRYVLFGGPTEGEPRTGVLLFDLDTGTLQKSWMVDQPTPSHIFNDLALTLDGDAYVTTTLLGKIFRVSPGADEMELVLDSPGSHNNGITLGPEERYLYFTLDRTISRMDLRTGDVIPVPVPNDAGTGTDGMYFRDGTLIVVKPRLRQIARLFLNPEENAVSRVEVLARDDPGFAYPTTGVLVGDRLVFVGTSFADVPRNDESPRQHPEVLIYQLPLQLGSAAPNEW